MRVSRRSRLGPADWTSGAAGLLQPGHEVGVLGGVQALLDHGVHRIAVAAHQGDGIEPEARKHRTAQNAVGPRSERHVTFLMKHEPVDLPIEDAPDDVFAGTVAPVSGELIPEVVTGAAGSDFGDQVGAPST